ncbi:MAG: CBS domain-containing protein [Candidatus Thermoplasmatota archaeon]|nr:CBS domain-containing protein [Candidatus Thermoplasmatota archaeon]
MEDLERLYAKKIEEVMAGRVWDLPILDKDANISHVLSVLASRSHAWVVENRNSMKAVGVITEHDILDLLAPKKLPRYVFGVKHYLSLKYGTASKAEDVMRKSLVKCSPGDTVEEALEKMRFNALRRLPVVKDEKLAGEITIHQLLQFLLGKRK